MSSPFFGILLLAAVQAATSPQPADRATPGAPTVAVGEVPRQNAGPYAKLFIQSKDSDARAQLHAAVKLLAGRQNAAPKIVCGMIVLPADPNVDPKMIQRPPVDPAITPQIRRIPPPACND